MEIITRKEAKELGLVFYFTGEECIKGHISDRYVSTNKCCECLEEQKAENSFQWEERAENRVTKKQKAKEALRFIRETLSEVSETEKTGLLTNYTFGSEDLDILPRTKEIAKELDEPFYDTKLPCKNNHLSKRSTETGLCVACVKENKENYKPWAKIYSQLRRKRELEADGHFSNADIQLIYMNQEGQCVYCDALFDDTGYHIDHIMPLCKGGSHWPDNLQLLCPTCNLSKSGKDPNQYEKEIGFIRNV